MSDAPLTGSVRERLYPDAPTLLAALAEDVAARLSAAVRVRGVASLVVTGGSTPGPLYDRLCQAELPWERVFITLSDDRWVDPSDEASNEHLARTRLLIGPARAARFVGLKTADAEPEAAEPAVGAAIARLPRPFDVVLLGMGGDGHVASLFPGASETARAMNLEAPDLVCAVRREGAAGAAMRMSLTFRALRDAAWTALLIEGEEKLAVARRARGGEDIAELPVRGVLNAPTGPVEIWWAP
jgi:6-phosphogluconolactonase